MARTPKNPLPDPERRKTIEYVLMRMAMPIKDEVCVADGTPSAVVDLDGNGSYRHKPLHPGAELYFRGFYLTEKTAEPTAILEPVDAAEWKHAEFNLKKLDETFPMLGPLLAERLELDCESLPAIYAAMILRIDDERTAAANKAREEEEIAKTQMETDNPMWGMFG